jgi:hypothetical protein
MSPRPVSRRAIVAGAIVLYSALAPLRAQQYTLLWARVSGGGGLTSGGNFVCLGVPGQVEGGPSGGGSFSLFSEFDPGLIAGPPAATPSISISYALSDTVVLTWPASFSSFVLQQKGDLSLSAWTNTGQSPTASGASLTLALPISGKAQFFRLVKP